MNNILSKWIPVDERSRSLALVYSGMYLGSVTGLAFSPLLIHNYGWPSVFYSFGSLGTVWFALWSTKVSCLLHLHSSALSPSFTMHSLSGGICAYV
jgi:MFS transporter, ACS family, solute carrier family 17 (sodium-dependent inorganic phosphate cotransporter), other